MSSRRVRACSARSLSPETKNILFPDWCQVNNSQIGNIVARGTLEFYNSEGPSASMYYCTGRGCWPAGVSGYLEGFRRTFNKAPKSGALPYANKEYIGGESRCPAVAWPLSTKENRPSRGDQAARHGSTEDNNASFRIVSRDVRFDPPRSQAIAFLAHPLQAIVVKQVVFLGKACPFHVDAVRRTLTASCSLTMIPCWN